MPREYAEAIKIVTFLAWARGLNENEGGYILPFTMIENIHAAAARIERQINATRAAGSSRSEAKSRASRENGKRAKKCG